MTTIGGLGHALPYLIPDFWTATIIADHRGVRRALGDRLDPDAVHGHAVLRATFQVVSAARWCSRRGADRRRLTGRTLADRLDDLGRAVVGAGRP
jgi:hypothetical protein